MAAQLYMPTLLLILGTVLVVFGMKYVSEALQARSRPSLPSLVPKKSASAARLRYVVRNIYQKMRWSSRLRPVGNYRV